MSLEGNAITEYASLSGKIHTLVIDKTLSISGAAADAKATGAKLEKAISSTDEAKEIYEKALAKLDADIEAAVENLPTLTAEEIADICV